MNNLSIFSPFLIYFFGVLSPGPANLAIIQVALAIGKKEAIRLSFGIVTGSVIWGVITFTGLTQVMQRFPFLLFVLSCFGAMYLLWLGYSNLVQFNLNKKGKKLSNLSQKSMNYFLYGVMLHLSNPKAFLVWTTILVTGINVDSGFVSVSPYLIFIVCALIGMLVFSGYAMLFSHQRFSLLYEKYCQYIHLLIGLIFMALSVKIFLQAFHFL